MAPVDSDRNLLFGLLALQNGLIDQGALFAAFAAWTRDKGRPLADHLVALGHLDAPRRAAVEAIAGVHVQALGGDPGKSLAVLAVERSTLESLAREAGPDDEATLGHVGSATDPTHDDDIPDRTCSYAMGSATSDGQRFRILRPHAKGGLGTVFVALDSELDREVALKQILDDRADDPASRFRFLIEAQITGGLEHPGIVPVYGLGSYGDGRPYYAMRFIRGDSLKEAIDHFHSASSSANPINGGAAISPAGPAGSRDLELRKLLRRFMDVCNAIDYAHSRGVIHRDIKPANIIVGKHGETLIVDWGLAKPTGRALPGIDSGERLLMPSSASGSTDTLAGSALGTPAYMSPEQAEGHHERLGPRSDVYSLGATLYSLLTGKPPFAGEMVDVIRAVQRGEFRPPRQRNASIDEPLEAICLKAMAHRPEDRYASCGALADDLDRWMADEPVTAWREPLARRARRWAKRNRTAVTAAAMALVAGVVGLSAVLAVQSHANAELTRSQAAVQARYDLAVDAIKTFHTGVSEDFLLKQEQFKDVRDRLLKSASEFYGKLGALLGKESDLASRRALWQANFEVAELTARVGNPEDALAAHRQVLTAREALATGTRVDTEIKADVGRSLLAIASLLDATGRTGDAEISYRNAETLLVELAPTISKAAVARAALALCRSRLGRLLHTTGRHDEALSAYLLARADQEVLAAEAGATAESRRDLAVTINGVGLLLATMGKSSEAEAEYRKALALYQKLAVENPGNSEFRSLLAQGHNNVGLLLSNTGKSSEALAEYREALALYQKLGDDHPAVTEFRSRLASSHLSLGFLLANTGKPGAAEVDYRTALEIQRKLADDNPAVTEFRSSLASTHLSFGWLLHRSGKTVDAETEFRTALAIQQKLADGSPAVTHFRSRLAQIRLNLGVLFAETGRAVAGEAEQRKALALRQKLADDHPAIPGFQREVADSLVSLGWQLAQAGKTGEAIGYYTREEAIRQKLAEASSATPADRDFLANCQTNTADVLRRLGRLDEAKAACERALAVREPLVEAHPEFPLFRAGLGETYLRLGQVRSAMNDPAGAAAAWKRACAHHGALKSLSGADRFLLACCHAGLAGLAGRNGSGVSVAEGAVEAAEAMAVLRQALTMGFRNPDAYRTESALDPLRNRPDFRELLMDLVFPAKPFA